MAVSYMNRSCSKCGYMPGTRPEGLLPPDRVQVLLDAGYEVDVDVHGNQIARGQRPNYATSFNSALTEFHRVNCRPTVYERLLAE